MNNKKNFDKNFFLDYIIILKLHRKIGHYIGNHISLNTFKILPILKLVYSLKLAIL